MSAAFSTTPVSGVLARLDTAIDDLAGLALDSCTDDEVLAVWRRLEVMRSRQAGLDHALINHIDQRGLAYTNGYTTLTQLAREVLRINPAEASARVKAAAALGPRRSLIGEVLEPIYPATAAALAAGEISAKHAQVIIATVEGLPDEVRAVSDRWLEHTLLGFAADTDPDMLGKQARLLAYALDQDGQYNEAAHRQRQRGIRLHRRVDGSGYGTFELTAECAEYLETMFDALAAPAPAADGTKDPRTPSQRRHDGLLESLKLTMRAGLLPKIGGVTATILLRMDMDAFGTGNGCATTGHGYTIPADIAKTWGGLETRMILVLLSKAKGIEKYSSTQRIFTEQQRLALMARDVGCTLPTCDAPALWTEAHHMTEYRISRRTCVDDGALLCDHHHDHFTAMGWTGTMINGRPHWTPPAHIDPARKPRRNTRHDHGID